MKIGPFVNGSVLPSSSSEYIEAINPSLAAQIFCMPVGSETDVDIAVNAAKEAFADGRWRSLPVSEKKNILNRYAGLIQNHAAELDQLDAEEMGKPIGLTVANATGAADLLRFYAEAIDKVSGDIFVSDSGSQVYQRWVPRGVVAAITPWNFPAYSALVKIAPALAAGNSLVLKPSEFSTRSSLRLAELAIEAGVPAGVFNIVTGLGHTVGKALALHNDISMIAFTGSGRVGKLMQQYAGQSNMKTVIAECGGKSPQIVFADGVDLDAAAEGIANLIMLNSGQVCIAGSRLLVEESIEQPLLEKLKRLMSGYIAGDALCEKTNLGPLVSKQQLEKVLGYIYRGLQEGGELVLGGKRLLDKSAGYFIEPTIIRNVQSGSTIEQEEIFGPVLSVMTFNNEQEAIQQANNTCYGLAANVWTVSLARGMRMANAIPSTISINASAPSGAGAGHAAVSEPLGESGVGAEGGLAGLQSYSRRQLVSIYYD